MPPSGTRDEAAARWVSTAVFVVCAGGLMLVLGSTLGLWAGLAGGVIVSGLIAGRLWASHLDNVANERTRAQNAAGSGRLQIRDEDDEDDGDSYAPPTRPLHVADDDD